MPASSTLINRAMTRYMARRLKLSESAASDLRQDYWHRYGATLAGLQIHHPEIDIAEFLRESHPIDAILTRLHGMPETQNTLSRLKGRKAVFPTARRLRPCRCQRTRFGKPFRRAFRHG